MTIQNVLSASLRSVRSAGLTWTKRRAGAAALAAGLAGCATPPAAPVYGPTDTASRAAPHQDRRVSSTPVAVPVAPPNVERLYPPAELRLCQGARVSNAPPTDGARLVKGYSRLVLVNGRVPLVTAPAPDVCLSSSFGPRFGRLHAGIDLQARPATRVFAGGSGVVREVEYARGYGRYILIDHGAGVFTRYAHLNSVKPSIAPGTRVWFGKPIGVMGRSGNATGIHLHYEILTGSYDTPRRSFGLTARDPFSFPPYVVQDTTS